MYDNRSGLFTSFFAVPYTSILSYLSLACQENFQNRSLFNSIIKKYTDFLHCGSNKYPEEVYQTLGINIREKQVFESAVEFFKEELNQYKTILKSGEVL